MILLALGCIAVFGGCSSGEKTGGSSTHPSAVEQTSSGRTSSIENVPSGAPAPSKLQGHWLLISKSGHTFKNRFDFAIRDRQYGFPIGLVRGEVVAPGPFELDFYNEDLCDLPFPEGVGRYRWTVRGNLLYVDDLELDPCATRRGVLDDATYRRVR